MNALRISLNERLDTRFSTSRRHRRDCNDCAGRNIGMRQLDQFACGGTRFTARTARPR
jgi:hypothetical protein